ncbi:nuclear transport factor 2 family protein [Flavihumibacter stibioxidans]|uniref:SnoaL-like domain-containing protein n=1 Tax=Flavihumibacter stibioxidans TaxID=1834163 RepID=A0ABR7M4L1_9BACT|nr:nuclear transport factor 2 family protein [Flavihumibacter stibioxidans]MBC6489866.1 hypothetical protein [Flavihumibacter stibioxidans]
MEKETGIVKSMYDAVAKGDFPTFLGTMDPAIIWNEADNFPYSDRNPYIGPQAVAEGVFGRIAADWDNFALSDMVFYTTVDDSVVVTGRYNGVNKLTGKSMHAQFVHIWRVKDNKAISFQQYADTYQVVNAMRN